MRTLSFYLALLLLFLACATVQAESISDQKLRKKAKIAIGTIPSFMPGAAQDTAEQIALGEQLYFEKALSINNNQSCNTCHNLLNGGHGTDNVKTSIGALGKLGRRNAPSTWNAGFQFSQNWDTSSKSLEEQAEIPITNPLEMALHSKQHAEERLLAYKQAFSQAFPLSKKPLSFKNITRALAAFQRTLITQDRFDQFLNGDDKALSDKEKQGFIAFQKHGCVSCHSGPLMGGQFAMKMGIVIPYPNTSDKGLAEITGREDHNFLFKVPTLRNVANTPPYFHDGEGQTLELAILLTAKHQLGKTLNEEDLKLISAFLKSLNNLRPYKANHIP